MCRLGGRLWPLCGHGRPLGSAPGPIRPVLPKGPFIPALRGHAAFTKGRDQDTYMRYGGPYLPPPGPVPPPIEGARTRALLHIGRGPLCAYC